MHVRGFVTKNWAQLLLLAVGVVACFANYTPGTFLSGWDTLHPEFNFSLAFERAFFGVFRPEQGLGAVAGHSHMADLPHITFLWLSSFVLNPLAQFFNLPQASLFRYCYIFLCYLLGPLGMYLFLTHLIPDKKICFLGSLFYMLNIGTVQLFYVPFEMFTTQYALLPFLFFFTTDFLFTYRRISLIGFCITTIFASPTAFAATLWYVMLIVFVSYCVTLTIFLKRINHPKPLRASGLLMGIFIVLNLYWILPNIYFVLLHGANVTQAASNQLFSEEAFLYNKTFGNLSSVGLLHTFYFNWQIFVQGSFVQLFSFWKAYASWPVSIIGFGFFGMTLVGFAASFFHKQKVLMSFFPALILSLFFLLNDNVPFRFYSIVQQIPLFQEAFRFPDDKILGIYVFLYTIFLAFGIYTLSQLLTKIKLHILPPIFSLLFSLLILISAFPIFQGQLIHPAMRIAIPQEYFALFDYLNQQPIGRIATLPINSLWGWEYYNWQNQTSYQGSGFLSFGLKDPTMDRDYDRWNPSNEAYYRELSYAVYTQNQALFQAVLKKYDISYILLDTSIIAPGSSSKELFYTQLQKLLAEKGIHPIAQFNKHLFVFKTQNATAPIVTVNHLPEKPGTTTAFLDTTFLHTGNYQTTQIANTTDNLARAYSVPAVQETAVPFTKNLYPNLVFSPKMNTCIAENFAQSNDTKAVIKTINPFIEYVSANGQYCDHVNITTQKPNMPLLIHVTQRNLSGLSLRVCIVDPLTDHCLIETKLPESHTFETVTLSVPPLPVTRLSINLANIGVAPTTSINDIAAISVEELSQQTIHPDLHVFFPQTPQTLVSQNNMYYTVSQPTNKTLLLSQSYEPGWQLYELPKTTPPLLAQAVPFLVGKKTGQHMLVNSWENGWILPSPQTNSQLVIVFLPQYLEFLGFGIGIFTLCILLIGISRAKAILYPFSRRTK